MSRCLASSAKWHLMCKRKTKSERTILCLCQCVRFNNKISKLQAMPVTCKIVYRVAQLPTNPNIRFYFQIFKSRGGHNNKDWKSSPAYSVIKAFTILSAVPMLYNFLVRSFPRLANPVVSGIYSMFIHWLKCKTFCVWKIPFQFFSVTLQTKSFFH